MSRFEDMESYNYWTSHGKSSKGPWRIFKFCTLGILLPVLCLIFPIYMRFQALKPHYFTISPSDMKLLNHEARVSTIWCEQQDLKMNSTFNAYLLKEKPKIQRYRNHISMHRKMILQDDIKEYWGFYLLRGSTVRLSVCSRYEGASFIIVKGLKDAKKCSYLGELDSNEELSDEFSDELDFPIYDDMGNKIITLNNSNLGAVIVKSDAINLKDLQALNRNQLIEKYINALKDYKIKDTMEKEHKLYKNNSPLNVTNNNDKFIDEYSEETIDNGIEDDTIYDLMDQGKFDQQDKNGIDNSREEVRSSWSSSEEALLNCEGLIYNVPLNGGLKCTANSSKSDLENITTHVTLDVTETGFYYFIFSNENEITDNFLSANFDMHKTIFDVSANVNNCTNTTECSLSLDFWSKDHVVLEIPQSGEDPCDALLGYSSLEECHRVIRAESICRPRKILYMGCLLLVPILILIFAYV